MPSDDFELWRKRAARAGERKIADTIRHLILRRDESIFALVDFEDDNAFLHPLWFGYFTYPGGKELVKPRDVIPWTRPQAHRLGPSRHDTIYVPGTRIEITTKINPLLFRHLNEDDNITHRPADLKSASRFKMLHALMALDLIREHAPDIWIDVKSFVRMIIIYRCQRQGSFASMSAHGALFCDSAQEDDEIAFLEDIAHQGAHVIFHAVMHGRSSFFTVDPDTPLSGICSEPERSKRSIHILLHACFTYTIICRILSAVYEAGALDARQMHELMGRLGYTLLKLKMDVELLNALIELRAFTAIGQRCADAFVNEFRCFADRYPELNRLEFSNQPYVFNYSRFSERNPRFQPRRRPLIQ